MEPYIRSREEAAFIRRVIALHLESKLPDASLRPPLALVDPPVLPPDEPEPVSPGLYRDYIHALSANIKAKQKYEAVKQQLFPISSTTALATSSDSRSNATALLSHRLALAKYSQKLARLQAVEKHLDELSSLPASSPSFFSEEALASDSVIPLPSVPNSVISGVGLAAAQQDVVRNDLDDLLNGLERNVLRAKLALKREEEALAHAKALSSVKTGSSASDMGARLMALTATRDELIAWIDGELSKVDDSVGGNRGVADDESLPGDIADEDIDGKHQLAPTRTPGGRLHKALAKVNERQKIEEMLGEIHKKYAHYMEMRRELIAMLQKQPMPSTDNSKNPKDMDNPLFANKPDFHSKYRSQTSFQQQDQSSAAAVELAPQAHLLIPYLSSLISLSREQKSLIQHKSHINVHLSRAMREVAGALDHVAEESLLLPQFPMPKKLIQQQQQQISLATSGGGVFGSGDSNKKAMTLLSPPGPGAEVLGKIREWRYAAGEAKITTLEKVAEKIEEGQLALESAMRALGETEELLGRDHVNHHQFENTSSEHEQASDDNGDDNTWLDQNNDAGNSENMAMKFKAGGVKKRGYSRIGTRFSAVQVQPLAKKNDIWERLDGNLGGLKLS